MIVRRLKDKETERHRWTMGYAKPRCSINSQSNSLIHIIMNEVLNNEWSIKYQKKCMILIQKLATYIWNKICINENLSVLFHLLHLIKGGNEKESFISFHPYLHQQGWLKLTGKKTKAEMSLERLTQIIFCQLIQGP